MFGAVVAAAPLYPLLKGSGVLYSGYVFISVTLAGLVIYGLTRLTDLVRELHDTRERLARMAVTQERLRFARDLHDLLGYSLSTVTLKGELVSRLIPVRPEQAAEETTSLLLVARQALADVRLVSRGYRDMSLCDEADSAAKVLVSAEVRVEVDMRVERLHPVVDTVLATALREGVTNILRHSKAEVCTIRATSGTETVLLTLVNDGVTDGEARRAFLRWERSGQPPDAAHRDRRRTDGRRRRGRSVPPRRTGTAPTASGGGRQCRGRRRARHRESRGLIRPLIRRDTATWGGNRCCPSTSFSPRMCT